MHMPHATTSVCIIAVAVIIAPMIFLLAFIIVLIIVQEQVGIGL